MSQGRSPPYNQAQEEKFLNIDALYQRGHGDVPVLPYWSETSISSPFALGMPLGKHMTNLSLLLCPCAGFGTGQHDGYCPLPEASPTVYDPNQPYGVQKEPYMHMPSQHGRDGLPFSSAEQYGPVQSAQSSQALSLSSYSEQERPQLVSPPDRAEDIFFPQDQSLAPCSEQYVTQRLQSPIALAFSSGYSQGNNQSRVNSVGDFNDTLSPHHASLSGITTCADVFQLVALSVGTVADQTPLGTWDQAAVPHQPPSFDGLPPDQRGGKRGPFKDPKLREQTAQTRRTGSCIRCRMQRIRCESDPEDPKGVCLTCTNVANTKAGRLPCLRYKITDIKLYKPGQVPGYEWTRRWTNSITDPIQTWASPEIKVVYISAGYSQKSIEMQVRKFIPQDGDKLVRTWDYRGTRKSVEIPPYALIDLEAAKLAYLAHIQDIMTDTVQSVLESPDSILCRTYFRAMELMDDPSTSADSVKLLRLTLTLWVSIRLSTRSAFLVGKETLGMPGNILDETNPNADKIPMPPVLGAQLDLILIHHIQTKLRREMLEVLQKMVLKNKQGTWFVRYLVTFILLHNAALITAHDAGYARKHGMKRHFAREDQVQEYHYGAKILLGHFHYYNKGIFPFTDECKDKDLRTLAELGDEELDLIRATKEYVKRQRRTWEQLRTDDACEDDFYFASQLFEENWKRQLVK